MHLDDERRQRLLHGELDAAGEHAARQHLAACQDCRDLLDEARDEEIRIFGLLREVDHPRAEVDPRVLLSPDAPVPRGWGRWVAGFFLLVLAGGAAYAAPGSPLPGMLDRLVRERPRARPQTGTEAQAGRAARPGAGIAVEPGEHLTIRFLVDREAIATVSLTDGREAEVRAVEGTASFSSGEDQLTVQGRGWVRFDVLVPRSAPSLDVLAGDTPVLRKRAADVISDAPREPAGRFRLRLTPPP
jgi:hypothetical protein